MKKALLLAMLILIAIFFAGCTSPVPDPLEEYKIQTQSKKLHSTISDYYEKILDSGTSNLMATQIASKQAEIAAETDQGKKLEKQKELFLLETQKESYGQFLGIVNWLKGESVAAGTDLNSATTIQEIDQANAKATGSTFVSMAASLELFYGTILMQQKINSIDKNKFGSAQETFQNFESDFQAAKTLLTSSFSGIYALCDTNANKDTNQFSQDLLQTIENQKEAIKSECTGYMEKYIIQLKSNYSSAQNNTKNKTAAAYNLLGLDALARQTSSAPDFNWPANQDDNSQGQDNCNEKTGPLQKDACYQEKAIEDKNPELCSKLAVLSKDNCINETAKAQENPLTCKKISSEEIKNSCYYAIGIENSDAQACAGISQSSQKIIQERDSCLQAVATAKKDTSACAMMSASYSTDHYVRDDCYWGIFSSTKAPEICQKFISRTKKEQCLATIASEPATINDCLQLPSDSNRNICIEQIAIDSKNYLLCRQISDSNSKRSCLNSLAGLLDSNSNEAICNEMTFTQDKDACEKNLAGATGKIQYCEKINSIILKDNCYSIIGIQKKDPSICEKILLTDYTNWDSCFEGIATANNDASLCIRIENQYTRINCVFDTAVNLQSTQTCQIFNPNYAFSYSDYRLDWLCYKNYAITSNNLFICDMIPDTKLNTECWDKNAAFK
ncbi:MAG: hypothetical protein PHD95_05345 [Candidatus ainarchaeum sp.]|nr:hypothetical protein [Candidatus ainarchaeum sp.]